MKINTQEILGKELSRKEFLSYVAAAILAASGVYGLLKSFKLPMNSGSVVGYGGGDYGNKKSVAKSGQKLL